MAKIPFASKQFGDAMPKEATYKATDDFKNGCIDSGDNHFVENNWQFEEKRVWLPEMKNEMGPFSNSSGKLFF